MHIGGKDDRNLRPLILINFLQAMLQDWLLSAFQELESEHLLTRRVVT